MPIDPSVLNRCYIHFLRDRFHMGIYNFFYFSRFLVCYTGFIPELCARAIFVLISFCYFLFLSYWSKYIYYHVPINLIAIRVFLHLFLFFKSHRNHLLMWSGMFHHSSLFSWISYILGSYIITIKWSHDLS